MPLGSYYDVPAGLGGVRVLAGLGCGGGCGCQKPMSGALDVMKEHALALGVLFALALGGVILFRETR